MSRSLQISAEVVEATSPNTLVHADGASGNILIRDSNSTDVLQLSGPAPLRGAVAGGTVGATGVAVITTFAG